MLTEGIQIENLKADILLLTPGLTATNMPRGLGGPAADSPALCAFTALRDLG